MIKALRRKFIAITMVSVVLVLFGLIGTMDILNYYKTITNIHSEMELLKSNGGDLFDLKNKREFQPGNEDRLPGGEVPFALRYFTVTLNAAGEKVGVNTRDIFTVDEDNAVAIAKELSAKNAQSGFYGDYYFDTLKPAESSRDDTMYLFLNSREKIEAFRSFRNISFFISALGVLLVYILVVLLSKMVMKPVAESYEKQKHFITDASHEIKTPLAIIEANAEVLEMSGGENEWIKSIRHQIERLTSLTEKLVFLSRMDEENAHLEMQEFSLSHAVEEVAESFLSVAKTKEKTLDIFVEKDISFVGNEETIAQAVSLLLDNALKYTNDKGRVEVRLSMNAKNKREISVFNTLEEITPGNHEELFERFYRADESRSTKTGGHGIGLSVVKAIVNAHKGKVFAESKDGASIIFRIVL